MGTPQQIASCHPASTFLCLLMSFCFSLPASCPSPLIFCPIHNGRGDSGAGQGAGILSPPLRAARLASHRRQPSASIPPSPPAINGVPGGNACATFMYMAGMTFITWRQEGRRAIPRNPYAGPARAKTRVGGGNGRYITNCFMHHGRCRTLLHAHAPHLLHGRPVNLTLRSCAARASELYRMNIHCARAAP